MKRRRLRRSRRGQRWALGIVLASLAAAAWAAHGAWERLAGYPDRPGPGWGELRLEVPKGASFPRVLALLIDKGVLTEEEAVYFRLLVLHKGAAGKITAGEHVFDGDMTPTQILEELLRPQPAREVRVTIPEGANLLDVARILAEAGLGDAAVFEAAMRDPQLLAGLGIDAETAEGYMFPDTYMVPVGAEPATVIGRFVKRHKRVLADLRRRYRDEVTGLSERLGWGDREIVTLASIVEKETAAKHERPRIAGVFLNRLRWSSFQPKFLATDPTIIYGCTVPTRKSAACQKFEGRIRKIHLRDLDNPYNTYTHEGLPPGPIANPGRAALEAVLAPEKSRFLYFVSRNDGTHQFSRTEAEHEGYVDLYQRKGKVGDGSAAAADPGE